MIDFGDRKKERFNANKTSLTIAIPSLNSGKTLHIPMNSILNQKESQFKTKIILLDSGSTDNTKLTFLSYKDKLDLIFKDVGKCSIGEARNHAIKFFKSDYFIFLDSDDAFFDDRLLFDYKKISQNQRIDFIYGDSLQIDKKSLSKSYYCKSTKNPELYQFLNIPYNLSSLTISRDFLMKNNIKFEIGEKGRLGEDWRFINAINSRSYNYLYNPHPKTIVNCREDSHTQDKIRCDLNISKIELICTSFMKIKDKRNFITRLFFSSQIQSSFFLSLYNIYLYTDPKERKFYLKNINKILVKYKKLSFLYIFINIFLIPLSIYLIFFKHRRSLFSPLRAKLSIQSYKKYLNFLK